MKKFLCIAIVVFSFVQNIIAQSLAINTSGATANASSILDVQSTTKGMLIPRMTKTQKNAIATPAIGLLVYQALPDSVGFHYYSGSQWIWLNPAGAASNDWSITGNAGTDTAVNFIGTTDNMPLRFKQNNVWLGQLNRNNNSYFIGGLAGKTNTTGSKLVGIGDSVLFSNTSGTDNVGMGYRALVKNTAGLRNVALGTAALRSNTFGGYSVAVGFNTLTASTVGDENVAIGDQAMEANTTGYGNNAIGSSALQLNTNGFYNTAIGTYSLRSNTTGFGNTALGYSASFGNTSSDYNIAVGYRSLFNNTLSSNLIGIGREALATVTSSNNLIAIGDSSLFSNTTGYKNIAIGNLALVKNTTGFQNVALGRSSLEKNTDGFANIAIGDSVLTANTTADWNIGIGRDALQDNTTGDKNIAIGERSLGFNKTGSNNVAVGYGSQAGSSNLGINNNNNTSLGFRTLWSVIGYSNTALGGDAMGRPTPAYTVNNNVAVGDSVMFNIQTGANTNTAVGSKALFSNTTGRSNTAIGVQALHDNVNTSNGVAVGDSAAFNANVTGITAIGSKALFSNTTGQGNVALGQSALFSNTTAGFNTALGHRSLSDNTGSNNTAVGFQAATNNTNGNLNTAVGSNALYLNTSGRDNTAIGSTALFTNVSGYNNTAVGSGALNKNTQASNTAVGYNAMSESTTGSVNTAIGVQALQHNGPSGNNNIAIGYSTLDNNSGSNNIGIGNFVLQGASANANVGVGNQALGSLASGQSNVGLGYLALSANVFGNSNTAVGTQAGQFNIGSGNVFLGYNAGANETGSNKLYIDNSTTSAPLIYGDFATNLLRVNGTLNINNDYSFPIADGLTNQVLQTNGVGAVSWATVSGETTTANNGLTLTGSNVALGGSLLSNTTLTHGNFNLTHSLSGTGDFLITTPSNNALSVLNTGNTGINTNTPTHRLHLINTASGSSTNYNNGMFIQNTAATGGQATLAFKNNVLPGNRAWVTGMNSFDNYVIAYGDSLSATNVVLRVDTAGFVGINPAGLPSSRLDVVGSFGNAIRTTTVNTTLGIDDHTIIIGTAAGSISVVLPIATSCDRREYIIVNRSSAGQTVSSYLDFSGTATTIAANSAITLQSNGSNWFRIQ